jgi:hypothetical protein
MQGIADVVGGMMRCPRLMAQAVGLSAGGRIRDCVFGVAIAAASSGGACR